MGGSILLLPLLVNGAGVAMADAVPLSLLVGLLTGIAGVGGGFRDRALNPRSTARALP